MKVSRIFKYPLWIGQKAVRGYSDKDMWNADTYLAKQIGESLIWMVDNGYSYAFRFKNEKDRNIEYRRYASIFLEYAENGPAMDEEWRKEFGGVLDKDLQEALKWFSEHFTEFWD